MRGNRDSMKRARRKLKSMRRFLDEGKVTFKDVKEQLQCQIAYFSNYNDHNRILRLKRLFYTLFIKGEKPMEYVAMQDCEFIGLSGKVSIKKGDVLKEEFQTLYKEDKDVCNILSQNGRDYFCPNTIADMYQYSLATKLIDVLSEADSTKSDYWKRYDDCEDIMQPSTQKFPFWRNHIREQPVDILKKLIERVIKENV